MRGQGELCSLLSSAHHPPGTKLLAFAGQRMEGLKSIQQEGLMYLVLFGAGELQSPPLGSTSVSNQVERTGRRSFSPAASMLLLLLILLLFSLYQAQGLTYARQAPQANHGAGGLRMGGNTWSCSKATQKAWTGDKDPPGPSQGVPASPAAPMSTGYSQVLVLGAFCRQVSLLSSPAPFADEPGNLRGVFAINKCKCL